MVVSICCISLIILIRVTWLVDLSCSLMRTQYEHQEDIALARGTALAAHTENQTIINMSCLVEVYSCNGHVARGGEILLI
ncbi:unnamed protein product [Rotaria socialis]|uniref:Secreted protein n=1 Tax=Rotaria socialis TaxID=392032 RepID=A0A820T8X0_9BILA|nr:unnamed protein product [Rotaria socialis]CAF4540655.1 unnamed protein product [Rotaria socialis]CAF4629692.1 unnamed protein product [Rotaria socialis]CAF4832310.1 unnamed protein product [Rotaria socialis]CAF4883699.1 unnamed protein product [Rotaria socialis]